MLRFKGLGFRVGEALSVSWNPEGNDDKDEDWAFK